MGKQCSIYQAHMDGCQLIKDLAEGMLSDCQLALMGLEPSGSLNDSLFNGGGWTGRVAVSAPSADALPRSFMDSPDLTWQCEWDLLFAGLWLL